MKKDGLDERTGASRWTRADDYFVALARERNDRRKRQGKPPQPTTPNQPRVTIGTAAFLTLMAAFALLFVTIAVLAWPSRQQPPVRKAERELGTAPSGWLEEAEQEMNKGGR